MGRYNDWYEYLNSLPQDLREIILNCWDYTGRPLNGVENPQSNAIIAVLKKHHATSGGAFMEDIKKMFPDMASYEAATYYNVYIAGARSVLDRFKNSAT